MRIIFDQEKCTGCGVCVVSCIEHGHLNLPSSLPYRTIIRQEEVISDNITIRYQAQFCQHCKNAPCINSCKRNCIQRDEETGLILLNRQNCIGCKSCIKVCPTKSIVIQMDGRAEKCNGCYDLILQGNKTACERACPQQAIRFEIQNI